MGKTIQVSDETYEKIKEQLDEPLKMTENYVIIRTYSAGVFAGYLQKREGQEVVLAKARRIWYWDGAASLSQLAMEGTSKPDSCQFPCAVNEITLTQAIEVIPCTQKAMQSIQAVKIWKK